MPETKPPTHVLTLSYSRPHKRGKLLTLPPARGISQARLEMFRDYRDAMLDASEGLEKQISIYEKLQAELIKEIKAGFPIEAGSLAVEIARKKLLVVKRHRAG